MKKFICMICAVGLLVLSACNGNTALKEPEKPAEAVEPADAEPEQPEKKPEAEEEPAEKTFSEMFAIEAEGIDYLSVEGIEVPEGFVLAMIGKDAGSGFWKSVKAGAEAAVADLNTALGYTGDAKVKLTYDAPDGEDVAEQIDIIDQMLDKNPDALAIGFVDVESGRTQLELAEANGIPVLAVDSGIENSLIVSSSRTDNYAAGAEAAKKLCEAIGDSGKVALLVHNAATETGIERERGFVEEIENHHPDVEVVDISYRQQDERNIDEIVAAVIQENPDLKAYFGANDQMTKELLKALASYQSEESQILIAGFDASGSEVAAIKDGTLLGVLAQNPFGMGYTSAVAAFRSMVGMENASEVDTGYYWIDSSNLEDEKMQALFYK